MIIYEFNRNSFEKIRLSINDYEGRQYFDLRIFFDASTDDTENWLPTKKGITLSLDKLSELKKGVDKAIAKAELGEEDHRA